MKTKERINVIKQRIIENRLIIVAGFISVLVAFAPYIQKDLLIGSDWRFHLARIETLALALQRGEFPLKFHSDLCYGFGYGVGFFYPNFFLYIPAIFFNMGFSLEVAYKLFAGMILCFIFLGMYVSIWALTHNKYVSASAAISYVLSISVLENFYRHFSVGHSLALIFLPMAFCGMYLIISKNSRIGRCLLTMGFAGLVLSHVLSTISAFMVCVILLLAYFKDWILDKEKWKELFIAVGTVLLITAAYWIPMLEQWTIQTYRVSKPWTYVDENVIDIFALLSDDSIGKLLLALSIVLGFIILEKNCEKAVKVFYYTGMILFLITTVYGFWHLFRNVLKFFQFPNRLFSVVTVCLVIALALWLNSVIGNRGKVLVVLLLIANIFYAYHYVDTRKNGVEDLGGRVLHEEIAGLGAGEEWLPVQTTRDYLVNPTIAYDSAGTPIEGVREANYFKFSVMEESAYYDVPFVFYKGFGALTEEGKELSIYQVPETGLVRVATENLDSGSTVTVWYKGTVVQTVSYYISGISAAVWISIALRRKLMAH